MRVLLLGPEHADLEAFLTSAGDTIVRWDGPLEADDAILDGVEFVVSFGYRHMIKRAILERFPRGVVNLHVSLLPWNRGADPNLWSFLDDTPKGVTIHFVDEGLDTGEIVAQRAVAAWPQDTLRSSYTRLGAELVGLFRHIWPDLRGGQVRTTPQPAGGSFHRQVDKEAHTHLLTAGWDTPVAGLIGRASEI
jgi:methionyl-tRNA formyltransferase